MHAKTVKKKKNEHNRKEKGRKDRLFEEFFVPLHSHFAK